MMSFLRVFSDIVEFENQVNTRYCLILRHYRIIVRNERQRILRLGLKRFAFLVAALKRCDNSVLQFEEKLLSAITTVRAGAFAGGNSRASQRSEMER